MAQPHCMHWRYSPYQSLVCATSPLHRSQLLKLIMLIKSFLRVRYETYLKVMEPFDVWTLNSTSPLPTVALK